MTFQVYHIREKEPTENLNSEQLGFVCALRRGSGRRGVSQAVPIQRIFHWAGLVWQLQSARLVIVKAAY